MTFKSLTGILLCFLLLQNGLFAQDKSQDHSNEKSNVKFGKVSPADFDLSAYKYDSGASAVVIADIGDSHLEGNTKGWFSVVFKHIRRVKIINKGGYEAAKEEIYLYSEGTVTEKLDELKATTYNLEGGKVVESKLDDKSIFTDKISKNLIAKKFSFPAVKEGSIIEYSYTTLSDYINNFQSWDFQREYPCLWSEYSVTIPEYFHYLPLSQGYQPFYIRKSKDAYFNAKITVPGGTDKDETFSLDGKATEYRMVMKDVPPLKDESFTTTINNHISKIEFQLSYYQFPGNITKDMMGNWNTLSEKLMASEYFGAAITKNNGWMDEEVKLITKGANSQTEKARKIFAYIRDNFTCTAHRGFEIDNPLKTVFKNKNGTAPEINLLLTAMLSHVNINTDPVILGTREHGYVNPIYPLRTRFNYVICRANIDTTVVYLDASQPWIGFGHLPEYCYNGHARVINVTNPGPVFFEADSLKEQKMTLVFISNDEKGQISGGFQSTLGDMESSSLREDVRKKGEKDYFKDIQTAYPSEIVISNTGIDSLKILDEPVKVSYDFSYKPAAEDGLIYFNPMLSEAYKTNPFKAAERKYPVEMPYTIDETYLLNMEVPSGFAVDEIPKSAKVVFNDTEGYFEYLVVSDGQNIQLRSHLKLNKANFKPEDYETLRDFFAFIVKKQGEQIVFKKKA